MIHSYKNLVCAALVGASFVACCFQPIQAKAIDISVGEQAGIYDYLDAGHTALFNIDFQFDEDSDGNRSKRIQIYGLQSAMLNTQTQIYDNMDFSIAPSTVSVSGSSASGLYRSALDNEIHGVTVRNPLPIGTYTGSVTATFATSDEFSYTVTFIPDSNSYLEISGVNNTYIPGMPVKPRGYYYKGRVICSGNSYFSAIDAYSSTLYNSHVFGAYLTQDGNIPTVSRNYSFNTSYNFPSEKHIGALGQNFTLPSEDVPTSSPWEYYNDVLLPYIENQFPDLPDLPDLLIFPDGYHEPVQPTTIPIVYPTMPGFDFGLIEDGTEPEGIETAAFELPQIETKSIGIPVFDFESLNPAEIVAPVSNGISGIWALITDVLSSFGLFPLVTLSLLVAVIGAILLLGR